MKHPLIGILTADIPASPAGDDRLRPGSARLYRRSGPRLLELGEHPVTAAPGGAMARYARVAVAESEGGYSVAEEA